MDSALLGLLLLLGAGSATLAVLLALVISGPPSGTARRGRRHAKRPRTAVGRRCVACQKAFESDDGAVWYTFMGGGRCFVCTECADSLDEVAERHNEPSGKEM